MSQIEFVHRLAGFEIPEVAGKLEALRQKIIGSGLIANITGSALDNAVPQLAQRFSRFGAPVPRGGQVTVSSGDATTEDISGNQEVFASASMQIGFAARSCKSAPFDTTAQIAEMVLAHQFSTGALWENIRMKGGAYGAFANSDCNEDCVSLATYRDPNPLNSLAVFSAILADSSHGTCDEDYLVKSIIGCYSKEKTPRTGAENGFADFLRFLYGVEDGYRKRRLERLVSVSTADIAGAFKSLGSRDATGTVIIAGMKMAEQAAKALGTEVHILPV